MFSARLCVVLAAVCIGVLALIDSSATWPASPAAAAPAARITQPVDESQRVELKELWREVRESVDLGAADSHKRADRLIMVLRASAAQDADLEQFLQQVQTRRRPEYHHWLTPSAFGRRFGVAAADLSIVRTWTAVVGDGAAGWLTVAPSSGQGSAPLTYSASANPNTIARSGTITVAGQVLSITQAAAAGSSGNSGQLDVSSSAFGFGVDSVGEPTAGQQLLISNTGNASLTLGVIGLSGSAPGDFSDSGTCLSGLVLSAGASCYLMLVFDPSALGSRTASLIIHVSGGGSVNVNLSGAGASAGDTDGPLPLWSYVLLAALLCAIVGVRAIYPESG